MKALITGASGQDGTLLGNLLCTHNVDVLGIDSRKHDAVQVLWKLECLDLTDESAVARRVTDFQPDQIYHLAACHHSSDEAGGAALDRRMLEANFRTTEFLLALVAEEMPNCRILFAGSSQMYTATAGAQLIVSETTPMNPSTFYGWTKAWSRNLLSFYRDCRNVAGCTMILFNHESALRNPSFVTRKISLAAASAKCGVECRLHLRNIAAETDWSNAHDIVEGMRLALSAPQPDDYVLASGRTHRVLDILEIAFGYVELDWQAYTTFDRSNDASGGSLVGDSSKIRETLGWTPQRQFTQTIEEMVEYDLWVLKRGLSTRSTVRMSENGSSQSPVGWDS